MGLFLKIWFKKLEQFAVNYWILFIYGNLFIVFLSTPHVDFTFWLFLQVFLLTSLGLLVFFLLDTGRVISENADVFHKAAHGSVLARRSGGGLRLSALSESEQIALRTYIAEGILKDNSRGVLRPSDRVMQRFGVTH